MSIGLNLPFFKDEPFVEVDIVTLATILFNRHRQFFRIIWHSNQNDRLQKTGAGAAYKARDVRKLYVATVRNDFSFENRVRKLCAEAGAASQADGWSPQARSWGSNLQGMPFVEHKNTGGDRLHRLYGKYLPMRYWTYPGITGYYVDGVKEDDNKIRALEYQKRQPLTVLDKARKEAHPVNARLDDIVAFKIGMTLYKIVPPTAQHIEDLAAKAVEFAALIAANQKKAA